MQRIHCDDCGKWIARVEDGQLFIHCDRCNSYRPIDLAVFALVVIEVLEERLARLRQLQAGQDTPVDGKRPRVFG